MLSPPNTESTGVGGRTSCATLDASRLHSRAVRTAAQRGHVWTAARSGGFKVSHPAARRPTDYKSPRAPALPRAF